MKKITMKIIGSQAMEGQPDDSMEFITEGSLYEKGEALYLIYEESEISGMPGCKTRLKLTGDSVKMKRIGDGAIGAGTEIRFEKGKRYSSYYNTPYGPIEMEVLTNRLENNMAADGTGDVIIDYNMSLKGLVESRNQLKIQLI